MVLDVQMESIQPISCYADSTGIARAIVTGGESPYVYSWSSGHVLDTAWNLWSDTHDLVVTDIRGCTQTASVTITENTEMISDLTSTAVSCYGYSDGSAQVNTLSEVYLRISICGLMVILLIRYQSFLMVSI